ncbi:hypothetical protein WJX84_001442 [Apatococcus fuscideae]|uniref:Uncharacterized protein n=1 Tax=Apatococcus fuscideae TaxID=2026836 RepID=A0AAW1T3N3_9CHLO
MSSTSGNPADPPASALQNIQRRIAARFGSSTIAWQAVQKATTGTARQIASPYRDPFQQPSDDPPQSGHRPQPAITTAVQHDQRPAVSLAEEDRAAAPLSMSRGPIAHSRPEHGQRPVHGDFGGPLKLPAQPELQNGNTMGRALRTTHATQGGIALISGGPRDAVMMSREADGLHQQDLSPRHGQSLFGGTGAQQDPGSHQAIPPRSHTPSLLNGSPDDAILDVRQVQMDPSRLEMPQQDSSWSMDFDEAHPALAGMHWMRSKDEDILLECALSESSPTPLHRDRRQLAANSLSEVHPRPSVPWWTHSHQQPHHIPSSPSARRDRPWSSGDALPGFQKASRSPPAGGRTPYKAMGTPRARSGRDYRLGPAPQPQKDKATGLFYPEDRARLGSLSAQIAGLQQSIEELRGSRRGSHASLPDASPEADADDIALDILTLAEGSDDSRTSSRRDAGHKFSAEPGPEGPFLTVDQDQEGMGDPHAWRDRSLADHLAEASAGSQQLPPQLLTKLGSMELRIAEARSPAHRISANALRHQEQQQPDRDTPGPDSPDIDQQSDAWMNPYRCHDGTADPVSPPAPARMPLADISQGSFLPDFQRAVHSAASEGRSWPRWLGPKSNAAHPGTQPAASRQPASQPFKFEQRQLSRPKPITQVKLEQDLALRAAEDRAARQGFRAKSLPISSIEPRYAGMLAAAKARREEAHASRQQALASSARPFNFYEADVERVRAKRAAASMPLAKLRCAPFKANPVPPTTLEARFVGLEADRALRKARASKRARLLLESSAAPARMCTPPKRPMTASAGQRHRSAEQSRLPTHHPVPDFAKLHASWERQLQAARIAGQRPPTAPQDSRFAYAERHASRFHAACVPSPEGPTPQSMTTRYRARTGPEAGSQFWSRPTRSQQLRAHSIAQRMSHVEWLRQLSQVPAQPASDLTMDSSSRQRPTQSSRTLEMRSQSLIKPGSSGTNALALKGHPSSNRRDTPAAHVQARHQQAIKAAHSMVEEVLLEQGLDVYNFVKQGQPM